MKEVDNVVADDIFLVVRLIAAYKEDEIDDSLNEEDKEFMRTMLCYYSQLQLDDFYSWTQDEVQYYK